MIYLYKLYGLKELKDFDLFKALDEYANSADVHEFNNMEELEGFIEREYDRDGVGYVNEPDYTVIIDADKNKIIKRSYMITLKVKTFKSDEEIQKLIEVEAKKEKESRLVYEKAQAAMREKVRADGKKKI